jgi:ribosome-associated toxin RatA of RatAB toxin-antitoxin module
VTVHLEHTVWVQAPREVVFEVALNVERWPQLVRAYRWCRVLERGPDRLTFAMGGWIRGWPARWVAVQEREAPRRLSFRHIGGFTRGMTVEWRFEPVRGGTEVVLVHDFVLPWPVVGRLVSDRIIGPIFLDPIARRTLQAVKEEAERRAG